VDYLWTPWRHQYMVQAQSGKQPDCIFCDAASRTDDENTLVVYRGQKVFIILNRFPYTSGHVMIVPYAHVAELNLCAPEALAEMMHLAQRLEVVYKSVYRPDGMNLGMNLGKAAGAGVAGHIHLHVLPRWFGDANFMSVTAETRLHPEELSTTYKKLSAAFKVAAPST
jgi:ATP adenylyltransferase